MQDRDQQMAKFNELLPVPRPRPELLFAERWAPVIEGQAEGVLQNRNYQGIPSGFPNPGEGDSRMYENWMMPQWRQFGPETPGRYPQMPRDLQAIIKNYLEAIRRIA
jgi:hypothetical protein